MVPALDSAHDRERVASQALDGSEQALAAWQQSWDSHKIKKKVWRVLGKM